MKMMRWLGWVVFFGWAMLVQAETYEVFTYSIVDGEITIEECSYSASGALSIPSSIEGIPVTTIDEYAFSSCSRLTSVTIPHSVTSIGDLAFFYCSRLTAIHVDAENAVYSSLDGVLFDKLQTTLVIYPEGGSNQYTIPDSVTSIGDNAFYLCSGLTSVMIPDSVTSIGDLAFYYSGLTNVMILDSVTSIGDGAFEGCEGLTSVTIPSSVTSIGDCLFRYCDGLASVTIPDSVTSIGNSAFYGCSVLASVTIPDSVISIGDEAFDGCSNLTTIHVDAENVAYSSLDGVLFDKLQTTLIAYPEGGPNQYTIPDSVTSIGDHAFSYCSGLTNVTISDSVTSIGDGAFGRCDGLASVTIPDGVTSIGDDTFAFCTNLTSVTIPECVTSIGDGAFYDCSGLTSVKIPDGVTSIGNSAFYHCTGLMSVTIPEYVTSIGHYAFTWCSALTSVSFEGNAPAFGDHVFDGLSEECVLYFYEGATGFSTPTFAGVSSVQLEGDSDLMPDGWEQQIIEASNGSFTTVFQVKPDDDFDADGMSNYAEYQAGTSPIDSESRLFVACSMNDATRELVWYGVSNRCYQVVYASELGAEWNPVDGEVIMGEDKEITYAVSLDLTNCFFRVRCAMDSADFS
ncbi:MAG: leucine-rich repeat domain-containing protein [Lentisphaerae bacterium]|nr:leucine-rich repeat domain-containing protein [Lentisphaerota bacterium]